MVCPFCITSALVATSGTTVPLITGALGATLVGKKIKDRVKKEKKIVKLKPKEK